MGDQTSFAVLPTSISPFSSIPTTDGVKYSPRLFGINVAFIILPHAYQTVCCSKINSYRCHMTDLLSHSCFLFHLFSPVSSGSVSLLFHGRSPCSPFLLQTDIPLPHCHFSVISYRAHQLHPFFFSETSSAGKRSTNPFSVIRTTSCTSRSAGYLPVHLHPAVSLPRLSA